MKEYLEKQADGSYELVMRGIVGRDDDIEVPDGAEKYIQGVKYPTRFGFVKGTNFWDGEWIDHVDQPHEYTVVWKRHTQPEELPFIDDEPKIETATGYQLDVVGKNTYGSRSRERGESDTSYRQYLMNFKIDKSKSLNDQYAEIEQVRQQTDSLPEFKHDFVNHPKHYCDHPSGIECIEITRHHDFAIGNAIKYLWRAGLKDSDNEIQDLKKAVWYIQDKIAQLDNK